MRVSISESDPDFWARKGFASGTCSVVLDGVAQNDCTLADEENGYVERYARDENGQFIDGPEPGVGYIERVYGRVTIVPFRL